MDSRLTATYGGAALGLIMMAFGLAGQSKSRESLVENPSFAPASAVLNEGVNTEYLAYSTIIPVDVPHSRPTPNLLDIAADSALQQQKDQKDKHDTPAVADPNTASVNETLTLNAAPNRDHWLEANSEYAQSRVAYDQRIARITRTLTAQTAARQNSKNEAARLAAHNILAKVSATHEQLHAFRTLLQPTGFQRPDWQDLSADAVLEKPKSDIAPFVVMIDPGHGGTDQGAEGHNGLLEKDLTLDIARRVRQLLTQFKHIDVKLTRNHDYGLSRQARVNAIKRGKADMAISLHFNHLPQTDINLVESYYAGPTNIRQSLEARQVHSNGHGSLHRTNAHPGDELDFGFTEGSARLAHTLHSQMYAEVSVNNESVQNAGVKEETLFVLTQSFIPSVLMELSCLSHEPEATRLEHDEYRNRLASALVDGIRDYHDSLKRAPLRKRGDVGA